MSTIIQRSFKILEDLSCHPQGRTLSELASEMAFPLSATHRLLDGLMKCGYVRKDHRHGEFTVAMPLVSLGLRFLSLSGITDVAEPTLERLAQVSGELVRLALIEEEQLLVVAHVQGARHGLLYEPPIGSPLQLSCSAAGFAWLATQAEKKALRALAKQGLGLPGEFGPAAPTTIDAVMSHVRAARTRGFSTTSDMFAPGMSSMAASVCDARGEVGAILIIAGPTVRLSEERMAKLAPALRDTAYSLGRSSDVSKLFRHPLRRQQRQPARSPLPQPARNLEETI